MLKYKPRIVAVLGVEAYRKAFGRRDAALGPQGQSIGDSVVWILPNPSGINAHYQVKDLAEIFKKLKKAAQEGDVLK